MSVENIRYNTFSQQTRTRETSFNLHMAGGIPISAAYNKHVYLLETTADLLPPHAIFSPQEPDSEFSSDGFELWETFKKSALRAYTNHLKKDTETTQSQKTADLQSEEVHRMDPDTMLFVQAGNDFASAIETIEKTTKHIQFHRTFIPELGMGFQRITLYEKKPEGGAAASWQIDEAILASLLQAHQKLHIRPERELYFVTIGLANYPIYVQTTDTEQAVWYSDPLQQLIQVGGQAYFKEALALLFESGTNQNSSFTEKGIITKSNLSAAQHESDHLLDPNQSHATIVQLEGFARAAENNFQLDSCITRWQKGSTNTTTLSLGSIEKLFMIPDESQKQPPTVEDRNLAATFFAYLFEACSPEVMMDWYSLVSGEETSLRGNTTESLTMALKNAKKEQTVEEVIETYIQKING